MIKLISFKIIFFFIFMLGPSAYSALLECQGNYTHWRDIAYLKPPMSKYYNLRNCVAWTAYQFELPEELLYSILYVERGDINGKCVQNKNGTQDCGPAQINDSRLGEIKKFNLTKDIIKSSPCHNIWVMGYLLRREIEKADGNIWIGTGNYHFHRSVNPRIHNRYVNNVKKAWKNLLVTTNNLCKE